MGPKALTPSGDAALTYTHGAGLLAAPANQYPAAFKSLGELFVFWKFNALSVLNVVNDSNQGQIYSLNGVSVHTAICVKIMVEVIMPRWLLYMAPAQARSGWYYMGSWLNILPGIGTGPVVTGLKAARYVCIANNGNIGYNDDWANHCLPNMSKLTQL